jgi:hypothetical protein
MIRHTGIQATTTEISSYMICQKLLESVQLAVRARMWYMRDGAPAHFSRAVREVLSNTCHDRCIGRGGPTAWPQRYTLARFEFWGFLPVGTPKIPCICSSWRQRRGILPSPVRVSTTNTELLNACGGKWWDVSRREFNLMDSILSRY